MRPRKPRMATALVKRSMLLWCLYFGATLVQSPLMPAQTKPARSPGEPPLTLQNVLKRMTEAAGHLKSLTADIERTKVTVVVNDKSTESGQLFYRKDDRLRIEFSKPDTKIVLLKGDRAQIYTPKIKQVQEYDLSKHRGLVDELLLIGFGKSAKDLQKGYLVTLMGETEMDGRSVAQLELTPKSEKLRAQINKIHLWLDMVSWLPIHQKFFEAGGDYFEIHYTEAKSNLKIPDSKFELKLPKDVTRIKPQV